MFFHENHCEIVKTISPSFGTGFGETSFENPSKLEINTRKQNTHWNLKKRMPTILHEKLNSGKAVKQNQSKIIDIQES